MANCLVNFFTEPCLMFSIIGKFGFAYLMFRALYKTWQMIKLYFLSPSLGLSLDVKSYGKWAVVTGSTDGIGKAYAHELAKKGMKLVLISRSANKLADTAKEIEGKYKGTEVKCVVADFTEMDIYKHITEQLEGLDIGVLVNNVGMSYDMPLYTHELSEEDARKIIIINTFSVVFMSKLLLERMVEKKGGVIINIASLSALIPVPLLAVYGASKAFVRSLSKSMDFEYKKKGIVVQCVSPGMVATKLSKIRKPSFFAPSPDSFAISSLATLGIDKDVTGCLSHELQASALNMLGEKFSGNYFMDMSVVARNKVLKKKELEDAKSKSQ